MYEDSTCPLAKANFTDLDAKLLVFFSNIVKQDVSDGEDVRPVSINIDFCLAPLVIFLLKDKDLFRLVIHILKFYNIDVHWMFFWM